MVGRLDVKELETWQKKDLQSLARQLGVSTDGTIKELVARIAEVEIGAVSGCDATKEELLEAAREEAESILNNARKEAAQIIQNAKKEETKDTTVECTERYYDTELGRVVEIGEQIDVTKKRAEEIINAGFAALVARD